MQAVELAVLDWIQAHLRCELLDTVMVFLSWTCNHGELWIALALILVVMRRQRRCGTAVGWALVVNLIGCNLILKPLFGRIRPFAFQPGLELLIPPPLDPSFPSGHTSASFAAAFALKTAGSPLWKPAMAVAVAMAFSRLYLYVHWPSDVLGGALLGAAAGWAGARFAGYLDARWHSQSKNTPET
ncbi:phosphatase PAP2 family protein [Oscillibacter sp.]|uniref:phosphatase PAP2 family protein n=1 Tax=Oscillibacter sp. TaxID=1945593 RepID=UPI00261EF170|nr:phosphatase PAP2 family protein [Oscillibacter sp.]MDD3347059.1 phosphatase PAP2 family protein [Oscillibacter sp.]